MPDGLQLEEAGDLPGDLGHGVSYCCPHDTNLIENKGDPNKAVALCKVKPRKTKS